MTTSNTSISRIFYLRNKDRHPVACVAININRLQQVIQYQYASLNPKDSFVKKVGRTIASGRLVKHPISLKLNDINTNMHAIAKLVIEDLVDNDKRCTFNAKDAALLWLEQADSF